VKIVVEKAMPTEAKGEAGTMPVTVALAHPLTDDEGLRITKDARIYAKRVIICSMMKKKQRNGEMFV
jgi:hypothetical protein